MRSYEAARGYFSFLQTIAWVAICGGGVIALLGAGAVADAARYGSPNGLSVFFGAVPGLIIAGAGAFGLVSLQAGRAAVDCAEYAQQALQVSRDQLSVSKELLALAKAPPIPATYTAQPVEDGLTNITFDTDTVSDQMPVAAPPPAATPREYTEYRGKRIHHRDGAYFIADKRYPTLIDAKLAVDGARLQVDAPSAD